jgi:hypothetical protein
VRPAEVASHVSKPMRKLLTFAALAVLAVACTDQPLAPVQTVDGSWAGEENGYSLSLVMTQSSDTIVTGSALIANVAGANQGTLAGTFVYPTLHLVLTFPGFAPVNYDGTMSQASAKIFGYLNGSGINNVEVDVKKQ